MSEQKGDQLIADGDKACKKFSLFSSSDEKYETAREKYVQAGTQYKAAGNFSKAGGAYKKAAEMSQKCKSEVDLVCDWEEGAKCYIKANDISGGVAMYKNVVELYDKSRKYSQAAKACMNIGEAITGPDAVSWLERAVKYYRTAGSNVTASGVISKIAEAHARNGNYEEARQIFDQLAREALEDRVARGGARKMFFMALLCSIAQINPNNLSECVAELRDRFSEYVELDTQFNDLTREHMLISSLIEAYEEEDLEKYEKAVDEYDDICPLDQAKSKMLLRGKQPLRKVDDTR